MLMTLYQRLTLNENQRHKKTKIGTTLKWGILWQYTLEFSGCLVLHLLLNDERNPRDSLSLAIKRRAHKLGLDRLDDSRFVWPKFYQLKY